DQCIESAEYFLHAFTGVSGNHERLLTANAFQFRLLRSKNSGRHGIGFCKRHDLGLFVELIAVSLDLGAHDLPRLACVLASGIDEMQQCTATLDVTQETIT